jgi:hypothetical protein
VALRPRIHRIKGRQCGKERKCDELPRKAQQAASLQKSVGVNNSKILSTDRNLAQVVTALSIAHRGIHKGGRYQPSAFNPVRRVSAAGALPSLREGERNFRVGRAFLSDQPYIYNICSGWLSAKPAY